MATHEDLSEKRFAQYKMFTYTVPESIDTLFLYTLLNTLLSTFIILLCHIRAGGISRPMQTYQNIEHRKWTVFFFL